MKPLQGKMIKHLSGILAVALTVALIGAATVSFTPKFGAVQPVYAGEENESTESQIEVNDPSESENTNRTDDTSASTNENDGTTSTQNDDTPETPENNTNITASDPKLSVVPAPDLGQGTLNVPAAAPSSAPAATQSAAYTAETLPGYKDGKIEVTYKYIKADNSTDTVTVEKAYQDSYLTEGYSFDLDLPADYDFNKIFSENGRVFFDWTYNAKTYYEGDKVTVTDTTNDGSIELVPEFSQFTTKAGTDHLPGYDEATKTLILSWKYSDGTSTLQPVTDPFPLDEEILIDYLTEGYFIPIYQMPDIFNQYKSTKYDGTIAAFKDNYFIGWSLNSNPSGINDVITSFNLTNDKNNGSIVLYPVFTEDKYSKAEYQAVFLDKSRNSLGQVDGSIIYDGKNSTYTFYDLDGNVINEVKAPAASSTIPASINWNTETDGSGYACKAGQNIKDYLLSLYQKSPDSNALYVLFFEQSATTSTTKSTASNTSDSQVKLAALPSDKIPTFVQKIAEFDKSFNKNTKNIAFYDISRKTDSSGKTKAFIPYPAAVAKNYKRYEFTLYHWKDNGYVEEIYPLTLDEDGVWFESDSFSPFALTWATKRRGSSTGSPNTGDDFNPLPIVIIAGVAAVGVVAVLVIKKKKDSAQ